MTKRKWHYDYFGRYNDETMSSNFVWYGKRYTDHSERILELNGRYLVLFPSGWRELCVPRELSRIWPSRKDVWKVVETYSLDWCIDHGETRVIHRQVK